MDVMVVMVIEYEVDVNVSEDEVDMIMMVGVVINEREMDVMVVVISHVTVILMKYPMSNLRQFLTSVNVPDVEHNNLLKYHSGPKNRSLK